MTHKEDEEAVVTLTVTMTPEQFISIKKSASWEGMSVASYLVAHATGTLRKGC